MTDVLTGWFAYVISSFTVSEILTGVFFIVALVFFARTIGSNDNDLEWADLISTRGTDGKQHADIDKVGKCLGLVIAVWLPFFYAHSEKMDAGGLALVMVTSLGYLGGVSAYAAWLRSKRGSVETTRTTEITPSAKITDVTTQTAPIA